MSLKMAEASPEKPTPCSYDDERITVSPAIKKEILLAATLGIVSTVQHLPLFSSLNKCPLVGKNIIVVNIGCKTSIKFCLKYQYFKEKDENKTTAADNVKTKIKYFIASTLRIQT